MDQYSRGMVPGYLGYRTRDPNNFKLPQPPSVMTTTGKVNFECHRREHPTVDNANFRNGMDGTMGFFTGGTISVSENGKSNAEKFYHLLRPGEGLPRIHYASRTQDLSTIDKRLTIGIQYSVMQSPSPMSHYS